MKLIIAFIIASFVSGCVICDGPAREVCSNVKAVGGCDRFGLCGVMLEDGNAATLMRPAPGERYCEPRCVK